MWFKLMMEVSQEIVQLISNVLQLPGGSSALCSDSALLGSVPEFDSMAVVAVLTALEDEFDITIEDDEISADVFESISSLSEFVSEKLKA